MRDLIRFLASDKFRSITIFTCSMALTLHLLAQVPPPRHPTRRVPEKTATPTAVQIPTSTPTVLPCAHCPDPESLNCTEAWASCAQCWADCGQPLPTRTPTPTPTPTPTAAGPCDHCPDPESFICAISWAYCVQCWEDCGQPIATPTPTPTPRPPTPTPTRTPGCWFESSGGTVMMIALYAHESTTPGVRYTATDSVFAPAGTIVEPGPAQGHPVGFEFYFDGTLAKSCGDTRRGYPFFSDGFESGDLSAWVEVRDD